MLQPWTLADIKVRYQVTAPQACFAAPALGLLEGDKLGCQPMHSYFTHLSVVGQVGLSLFSLWSTAWSPHTWTGPWERWRCTMTLTGSGGRYWQDWGLHDRWCEINSLLRVWYEVCQHPGHPAVSHPRIPLPFPGELPRSPEIFSGRIGCGSRASHLVWLSCEPHLTLSTSQPTFSSQAVLSLPSHLTRTHFP